MKNIIKLLLSFIVLAMMVVMVPMQVVHAQDEFVFIPDANESYYKYDFEIFGEDDYFETEDPYGVAHAFVYGGFKEGENPDEAIFSFEYYSTSLEDKARYFVVETFFDQSEYYVSPGESLSWDLYGYDAAYVDFSFDIERYNSPYLYFYVGFVDVDTEYAEYVQIKVENPYYTIPVNTILLNTYNTDIAINATEQLRANVYPSNASDKSLKWSSSDETIVKVDQEGVITGVGFGTATVTVESVNGISATCTVDVKAPIEKIDFEQDEYNILFSEILTLNIQVTPEENFADRTKLVWKVENENIAHIYRSYLHGNDMTINDIKAVGPGSTIVTVTAPNGVSAQCVINVEAPITDVFITNNSNIKIRVDNTYNLGGTAHVIPENTNYEKKITWSSSNDAIATVDANGVVTGVSEGKVNITATATNGVSKTIEIEILAAIPVNKVVIGPESKELFVGERYNCYATVEPSNTSMSKALTWSSSNESVATVNENGEITAISEGEAIIKASAINGIYDTIAIRVNENTLRIFGDDRYETAFKVADTLKGTLGVEKFNSVIITSGANFADALAGSYLAAKESAPILMTDKKQTNIDNLISYVNNNLRDGGTVYILGGTAAIGNDVQERLSNFNVKRLSGNTRYDTNMAILNECIRGKYTGKLLVCTGTHFADSLSVSATGLPILLVGNSLTSAQKEFLTTQSFEDVYIIGGEAVISRSMANKIDDLLLDIYLVIGGVPTDISPEVIRIAGATRYETSVKVAEKFFPEAKKAVVAYGLNYPDGLSGGALANAIDAPLLLTQEKNYKTTSKFTNKRNIKSGYVLGGSAFVTDNATRSIFGLDENQEIDSK